MSTPSASVDSSGNVSATAYGVKVDSTGQVDFSGAVDSLMDDLDKHTPQFWKDLVSLAANEVANFAELEAATTGLVNAANALLGLSLAAGPLALFTAVAVGMLDLHNAVDANKKPCCQSGSGRFGSCNSDIFSWYGTQGLGGEMASWIADPRWEAATRDPNATRITPDWHGTTPAQEYIGQAIIAAHDSIRDCQHPDVPTALLTTTLLTAAAAWKKTHPTTTEKIIRSVNTTHNVDDPKYGKFTVEHFPGDPLDPISVAMSLAVAHWDPVSGGSSQKGVATNAIASLDLSTGKTVYLGGILPIKMPSRSTVKASVAKAAAPSLMRIGIVPPALKSVPVLAPSAQPVSPAQPRELLDMTIPGTTVTVKAAGITAGAVGLGVAVVKKLVGR